MAAPTRYAEVLLPLPVSGTFTYAVPTELESAVKEGVRVVVQFGRKKIYAALVKSISDRPPSGYEAKSLLAVLDEKPLVHERQFRFWEWIAAYYLCQEGEVMNAALPSAFKLESESKITLDVTADAGKFLLGEKEELLVESLLHRKAIRISEVAGILDQRKTLPVISSLIEKGIIRMEEELPLKYHPKKETFIRLTEPYQQDESLFRELFDRLEKKSPKQLELLMSFLVLSGAGTGSVKEVTRNDLLKSVHAAPAALEGLIRKEILETVTRTVSRIGEETAREDVSSIRLEPFQEEAFETLHRGMDQKGVVLLHGVTSSGKTELYIKLIKETLDQGKQVLYLLPEIALTTQIINRLKKYFGGRVGVYHSRFNENERVEIWNRVGAPAAEKRYDVILGARSAVFLPFYDLGLVIVDEEHDSSFKQYDPAPRYNGRDAALYLAHLHGARSVLGSATPSLESYYLAMEGKYALSVMSERYGKLELPEVEVVNIREEARWKKMRSHFSSVLVSQLDEALKAEEQAILFQNRRGFSLRLECDTCNWMPVCKNCDVTLVYHKQMNHLRCHYCGYTTKVPDTCPSCGNRTLRMKGFGTEKVEEDLSLIFPKARIARMDLDTTRSRYSYRRILDDFEQRKIDILVGTQMVTKGLDFDNVSTVGILNADNMLSFPDFRSAERSFQLMAQVSGRSGRKKKRGRVIIQTYNPRHPVLADVVNHDYVSMYRQQLADRLRFRYPPFFRLIRIELKHRDSRLLGEAARDFALRMKKIFANRVLGPEYPMVSRIKNEFIQQVLIKIERTYSVSHAKESLMKEIAEFHRQKEYSPVRLVMDVDPV
ncbi:MAG TPA: primosomal protein N' [Bacteroidales bacterium]|nr:primosomal protein N' [Bacteroidales bacterium]